MKYNEFYERVYISQPRFYLTCAQTSAHISILQHVRYTNHAYTIAKCVFDIPPRFLIINECDRQSLEFQ